MELTDKSETAGVAAMRDGTVRAVFVVPKGFGDALAQAATANPGPPVTLTIYTDPTQQGVWATRSGSSTRSSARSTSPRSAAAQPS